MNNFGNGPAKRGAGGTPGGILEFFVGVLLIIAGGYLFINQVTVISRGFRLYFPWAGGMQFNSFGLALIPLLIGIAILFFNGRNLLGWFLLVAGALIVILGILTNLDIYFQPTSLFNTLNMLGLIAAGVGIVARSLQPHGGR